MCHAVFLQIIVYGGLLNFEHFLIYKCENVEIREIEIFKYHSELMGCALSNVLSYVSSYEKLTCTACAQITRKGTSKAGRGLVGCVGLALVHTVIIAPTSRTCFN